MTLSCKHPHSIHNLFTILLLACGFLRAQHHHADAAPYEIDLSKIPPAVKIDGIGHSHITVTTKSPEAQQWFDQGIALLHCFWDYEALRSFEQAVRLDPDCAMCHWGLFRALDFEYRDNAARTELARAKKLMDKATEHERFYILAAANEENDKDRGHDNTTAFRDEMYKLIERYPDDVEAKLFLIDGGLDWGYDAKGDPLPDTTYVQSMLRGILQHDPQNVAANHYYIHSVESGSHPEWGLASAAALGELAPGSSHLVHMPGHLYYRLGDYEKARLIFLQALSVDENYMQREHVSPRDNWNYAHNISYLIAACAEEGHYKEAATLLTRLQGLADEPDKSINPNLYVFQIAATGARLNVRFLHWQYLIDHPLSYGVPDSALSPFAVAYRDGLLAYARGMKALESGNFDAATAESDRLVALLWRTSQLKPSTSDKEKNMQPTVVRILSVASFELPGRIASVRNQFEQARELLTQAVQKERNIGYSEPPQYSRPALESLGYACIRAGRWDEARDAFEQVLKERPKSGFGYYGLAVTAEKSGDRQKAVTNYRAFLDAWKSADADLPQVIAARRFLSENGGAP
jgi:tetratricopeptide (TPR) repeat protein